MQEPTGAAWAAAKQERNWLLCRAVDQPGRKPRKLPVDADDRHTLTSFERAARLTWDEAQAAAAEAGPEVALHVGYLPRSGSAMVVLDLDGCLHEGELSIEADRLMTEESYCEISVSETGLHLLLVREGWPEASIDTGEGIGLIADGRRFALVTLDWSEIGPTEIGAAPRLMALALPSLAERLEERAKADRGARASGPEEPWHWFAHLSEEQRVEAALAALQALGDGAFEYDRWRDVTFAFRSWPELFEAWDAWCRLGRGYDAEGNLKLWSHYDRQGGRLRSIGSLLFEAEGKGADFSEWKQAAEIAKVQAIAASPRLRQAMERARARGGPGPSHEERPRTEVTRGEAEAAGELVLTRHNDPTRAVQDAQAIERHLGERRVLFSVNMTPSYIYSASISIRNPDTGKKEIGLAHVFKAVEDWSTMCHGHVRYIRPPGTAGRPPASVLPPMVAAELKARGGPLLPPLADIVQHPALLFDGRLLVEHKAHYDEASHMWIDIEPVRGPRLVFNTPEHAVAWIENEWLRDFAFDTRDDCARALTLAASLLVSKTMLGEDAGPPSFVFTAPQASTGKTVLARVMVSAITGRSTPTTTLPVEREEMRKVLFALALQQDVAAVFDNVPRGRALNDAEACQFTTDPVYKGRMLGRSEMVTIRARMALVFTGNAVQPSGDMIPRTVTVRMRWAGEGSPSLRRFDRQIVEWTIDHRATILEALRVILTAQLKPGWQATVGRFQAWSLAVLQPIAQAFGLSAERLVKEWIVSSAEDELQEDFVALFDAMTKVGMQYAGQLRCERNGITVFTTGEMRDFCGEALARLEGCMLSEVRNLTAKRVSGIMNQFVDLGRGDLVLRRLNLNLGERTDRKMRVCYALVNVDFNDQDDAAER